MDPQTQGQGFNWSQLINQANSLALAWYTAIRRPDTLGQGAPGTVGGSVGRLPGGGLVAQAHIDPMLLIVGLGAIALVAVLVLRR